MIKLKEAVIVEGRYDKIKLSSIIDAPIIETNGFRIFKDKEKQSLIRKIAKERGILIFTDSDSAGFVIRNFLKGAVDPKCIKNAYIPEIKGKEKRKPEPSKEGILGVEGISESIILQAIRKSGATIENECITRKAAGDITKQDLYAMGLSGSENSAELRKRLLHKLDMPAYITSNAMLTMLNCLYTKAEFTEIVSELISSDSV